MADFGFHPDALLEYVDAANRYLEMASRQIAERFVTEVEAGVASIVAKPDRWRVIGEPKMRPYVCRRFPYVIYYHWDKEREFVTIYAVMHCSREPRYWKQRIA